MVGFDNAFSKRAGVAVSAGLMAALMSTGAWAQANCTAAPTPVGNVNFIGAGSAATTGAVAAAIGNVNTAFLTQQGSAFVSAPPNPAPDQPGGGVWARAVGGEVTLRSNTTSNGVLTSGAATLATTTSNCINNQRQDFGGGQIGADIARLNWNGWNVHLGTTAGYLSSNSRDNLAGFGTNVEVPFFGTYVVATYGRFFADVQVRQDYYNIRLDNPTLGFFNQPISAHGYSISSSAGYNFALANNWFIEPSAGFIYSDTKVDSYTAFGLPIPGLSIGTTNSFNDVKSEIGRLSLRVGTTISTPTMVWQPFASASVFHEFAGNVVSNSATLPNNVFVGAAAAAFAQNSSTNRVGTYGQYSVGVAGQVVNTGWLGFVRVDYRNGDRIDGYTGNVGLRYQFTPGAMDALAADMPMKVKAPRPVLYATNWTGFYVGGFFGGDAGRTDIAFVGQTPDSRPWVSGPLGGGQIGYNWQGATPWVFGVEGDIGAADIKGARTCGPNPGLTAFGAPNGTLASAYFTCGEKTDWVATATARVGYSYNRTLYYVRGGGAWEDSTVSANCILGPTGTNITGSRACTNQAGVIQTNITTGSQTRTGWVIGFGTEFDLGKNWSAKTEYNYIDFGRHTALASDGVSTLTDRTSTSQVKVGVNYRFGPGAVVAKY